MTRTRLIAILALAALVPAVAGGFWVRMAGSGPSTGFVAVTTTFSLPTSDAFVLGEATLDPLNRGAPAEATFTEPVGVTKLRLRRAGQLLDICEVSVRSKRITTVTVLAQDNKMRCKIEG